MKLIRVLIIRREQDPVIVFCRLDMLSASLKSRHYEKTQHGELPAKPLVLGF